MKIKNVVYFMLCICLAFFLSACIGPVKTPTPTPSPVPTGEVEVTKVPEPTAYPTQTTAPSATPTEEPVQPSEEDRQVTIYCIDAEMLGKEGLQVMMSEVTPELIVEEVCFAYEDKAFFIGINEVVTRDDTVIIDFKWDTPPVIDVGAYIECVILDSFAQSILENIPEYSKIIYRIEGGPYATGHVELGLNEVYMSR